MTTVKISDLLDSVESLRHLGAMDLPIRLAFRIKKILRRVQEQVDDAIELKEKLLDTYTVKGEDGKPIRPLDKNDKPIPHQVKLTEPEEYHKKLAELHENEVSMQLEVLKPSDFGDRIEIKPAVLLKLHWLIAEEPDAP